MASEGASHDDRAIPIGCGSRACGLASNAQPIMGPKHSCRIEQYAKTSILGERFSVCLALTVEK